MKINLLYIEDTDLDQLILKDYVSKKENNEDQSISIDLSICSSIEDTKLVLQEKEFDLIITDYILGDGDGFDVFTLNKQNIPVIFLTGMGDELIAVRAMKQGAINYIVKDLESNYLNTIYDEIERFAYNRKQKAYVDSEIIKTDGLLFYLDKIGPRLLTDKSKLNLEFSEQNLFKMGSFFYLAIGLGNDRNIGLYELPVPGHPDHTALVYATEINDENYQDPRSPGINYILLAYIVPKSFRAILPHSSIIETKFKTLFEDFPEFNSFQQKDWLDKFNRILKS